MKTIAKASAVLLVLTACARAQHHASASIVKELSRAWVRYYAETYHVPTELVEAIIDQESAWDPYALSSKGAAGLMQLMPNTTVRFGVRNRFRVEQNIKGGVAYLAWLNGQFNGDLRLITAAYYVGEAPIYSRGLAYANRDVHEYVSRVAARYRARCAMARQRSLATSTDKVSHELYP